LVLRESRRLERRGGRGSLPWYISRGIMVVYELASCFMISLASLM
jgi:hypothetical protein